LLLGGLSGGSRGLMVSQSESGTSARAIAFSLQPGCPVAPRCIHRHHLLKL
jgi:hypothetical protein